MGDRGHVLIEDNGVYLYSHWGASELVEIVKKALARRLRWDDPEYLARIIFCEMVKGQESEETGFGIGTAKHEDVWRVVKVNCGDKTVTVEDNEKVEAKVSFEELIRVGFE